MYVQPLSARVFIGRPAPNFPCLYIQRNLLSKLWVNTEYTHKHSAYTYVIDADTMVSCGVGVWGTRAIFDSHNDALEPHTEINDKTKQEKMKESIRLAFMRVCVCV